MMNVLRTPIKVLGVTQAMAARCAIVMGSFEDGGPVVATTVRFTALLRGRQWNGKYRLRRLGLR